MDIFYDSHVSLGPLLDFIHRHPSIRELSLSPRALLRASLPAGSLRPDPVHIISLSTSLLYVPYLQPAVFGVEELKLKLDARMQYDAYVRALAALDSAWAVHTFSLNLYDLPRSVHALSWRAEPNAGMEALLHTIRVLEIHGFRFTVADIAPLVHWLTRFPALVQIKFDANIAMGAQTPAVLMAEPAVLARFIAEAIGLPLPRGLTTIP